MEEEFRRVFGESSEEVVQRERQGDAGEEAVRTRARKVEMVPSSKEVEERSVDHAVFRNWCPHCVKTKAESYGHVRKGRDEGAVPTIGVDYKQAPVGDHQTNRLVENAVKNVQGQLRVIKDALESRRGRRTEGEHPARPWMMTHAASVMASRRTGGGKGDSLRSRLQSLESVSLMPRPCLLARTS